MKINYFGKSDIGRVRTTNEDYFSSKKINDNEYLFIIADGMGGHQAGEVASKLGTDTFVREYKKSRKKRNGIEESMVNSLKKSNASILKRSLADPMKRGMGTTFTALVIAGKKATVVHVGDSRIYLIRKNRIKKMTTDHTFVEKMLSEGKINEQEAREHPQKNILYQSLGAREFYSPEIIRNTEIKRGDIITMCSDGLNNMVEDHIIKKYAQNPDPEAAVNELIKRANEKGGTDNITVQIIHTGPAEKEKTAAKKKRKPIRNNILIFVSFISVILYVASPSSKISVHRLFSENLNNHSASLKTPKPQLKNSGMGYDQNLYKIDTRNLFPEITADQFLFFSGEYIFFRKQNQAVGFSLIKQKEVETIQLRKGDYLIPTTIDSVHAIEDILMTKKSHSELSDSAPMKAYIFKKSPASLLRYQIVEHRENKLMVTVRSDPELNSVDHEIRTIGFLNLKPPLIPVFMNSDALIFHDKHHFYVIKNPEKKKNKELKFYQINDILYEPQLLVSLKAIKGIIKIIFFNIKEKTLKVFEISRAEFTSARKISFEFTEMPLAIEYINENSVIIYFSYGYINLTRDNTFIQNYYGYNDRNLLIRNIMIDYGANRRILVDKNNRLFILLL